MMKHRLGFFRYSNGGFDNSSHGGRGLMVVLVIAVVGCVGRSICQYMLLRDHFVEDGATIADCAKLNQSTADLVLVYSCKEGWKSVPVAAVFELNAVIVFCEESPPTMWRFKPFTHKEQTGLEGRVIDIGNFKVQVRNAIAEGGFSCVYLARDAIHGSKQYALKHIICNDEESLELVMKEVLVMKTLKGHPNVVTLHANAIFDMGRTKEAFLLMEYCEKSLVSVLESRGAGFFEEKQVLTIFRDVCNAVFAMHCQTPPIAHRLLRLQSTEKTSVHLSVGDMPEDPLSDGTQKDGFVFYRDLKAENLLLGSDGLWKLCDFGSTSTNHKRFVKPEEMGIEEDNIRKHTTPAYRAPEMWDLFRRELINEKVDIWALGCLLFRICYLKSAFDGESKLQVLNGNYKIPDLPKYNTSVTDLIRDLLQSSPDDRPDITQASILLDWPFSMNLDGLQKSLPDRPPEMLQQNTDVLAGMSKPANKSSPMPRRSPPPPPSAETSQNVASASSNSRTGESSGPLGAFWTTQHAKDSEGKEDKTRPKFDEDTTKSSGNEKVRPDRPKKEQHLQSPHVQKLEINLFPDDLGHNTEMVKPPKPEVTPTFQNNAFNAFVAEFNTNKQSPSNNNQKLDKEELLAAEVEKLKEQLANVGTEKAEITSKYEKLSAICRSQRQEIQDLKHALAARTPSPNSQQWQAFSDDSKPTKNAPKSVRTRNGQQNEPNSGANTWGFGTDNFKVVPTASSKINAPVGEFNNSQRFGESKSTGSKLETQPAGWAGF
ncbi:hypothetical protein BUALT_Bualt01G0173900 [Buddleja alternifolia]|uniref:non-specific serine/threonine protein kinase n=1 Tax=Buddleja alternifolia TaxID=168488 RepID=A0AAV6YA95_9LAMI|nr:hypothetical protein BUALT_Bualt01G0173900 [Buddleja alternifolia]